MIFNGAGENSPQADNSKFGNLNVLSLILETIKQSHDSTGILNSGIKVPLHWTEKGSKYKTRTQMKNSQKLDIIPDGSYDIDGDGNVGVREYVKIFLTFLVPQQNF